MTAACLTGVFVIRGSTEVRTLPSGDTVLTLALAYRYGTRHGEPSRPTQLVEGGLWGTRATKLAPRLLDRALVYAVIEDVHVEAYTTAAGVVGHKMVGRLGRIEVIAPPQPGASDQNPTPQHLADSLCRPS